ncbi:copper chaperone PCu(A)C [Microvirga mediterraneensis]|jgi:copper(I)-binding protein|uniref:Copper chaperone PCu(A)C n=1 Tax=Microvirga mediterraneensis TaxID=2754695 RepID=A0A838BTU9_9HYPH|nr:copper chaperone PCu(A)C [Microvirga mediterraneensis]MBA1158851.1 copper chaperone PCu(A)C [Microvirga mediterraneensis]
MADPAAARQNHNPVHSLAFMEAWAEKTSLEDSMTSARFSIVNLGSEADELIEASSPDFERVVLHAPRGLILSGQDPIAAATARIPSYSSLTVGSYGFKVLLIDPVRPLRSGNRLTLTLRFRNSGHITIGLPVPADGQQAQLTTD